MPFCPQCGVDNPENARFCDQCGAALIPVTPAQRPAQPAIPAAPVAPIPPAVPATPAAASVAPSAPPVQSAAAPAAGPVACPQCGTTALPGEAFCDNCGASLLGAVQPVTPTPASVPPPPVAVPQPVAAPPPVAAVPPVAPVPVAPPQAPVAPIPTPAAPAALSRSVLAPGNIVVPSHSVNLPLPNTPQAIIGRADPVSNVFPEIDLAPYGALDAGVSRRHARLFVQAGQVMLEDLETVNGTFINNQRLAARTPQPVRDGDELRCGTLPLQFKLS